MTDVDPFAGFDVRDLRVDTESNTAGARVTVTHLPTGIVARSAGHSSQFSARREALKVLAEKLDLHHQGRRETTVPDPQAGEDAAIILHRSQFVDPAVAGAVWAAMLDGEREKWRALARAAMEMRR